MVNSRAKGKRGELLFCQYLRERGYEARRGCQFQGGPNSPDAVTNVPDIHWEVKFTERDDFDAWLAKAQAETPSGKFPVIARKRKHGAWVALLRLDDLLSLTGSHAQLKNESR